MIWQSGFLPVVCFECEGIDSKAVVAVSHERHWSGCGFAEEQPAEGVADSALPLHRMDDYAGVVTYWCVQQK